ncbi:hypothetical protein HYFRA_00010359 [Hymenoscyphus fraxineus]|uniref:AAA+ ATPase domain-containing protein n=1 Tax=Hymenoscyphus fraxineus TaxID=746836 RepID=A0A9N9PVD7_9HELO|nr:hypothetical protein HYFRA_00010359 [Hymenoscyphus fraxineus]
MLLFWASSHMIAQQDGLIQNNSVTIGSLALKKAAVLHFPQRDQDIAKPFDVLPFPFQMYEQAISSLLAPDVLPARSARISLIPTLSNFGRMSKQTDLQMTEEAVHDGRSRDTIVENVTRDALLGDAPLCEGILPFGKADEDDVAERKDGPSWTAKRQKMQQVIDVKWSNFSQFKNRYGPNEGLEIIEVLRGHQNLAQEISEGRRQVPLRRSDLETQAKIGSSSWIHRVRIQSPSLLLLLARLTGNEVKWNIETPRVFVRPFRTLYHFLPQIKKCLESLEENWAQKNPQEDLKSVEEVQLSSKQNTVVNHSESERSKGGIKIPYDIESDSSPGSSSNDGRVDEFEIMEPHVAVSGEVADSPTALKHVRMYIKFVEEHIVPIWERAAGTNQRKVRWSDLWMYFVVGDLLYFPGVSDLSQDSQSTNPATKNMIYQSAWRLHSLVLEKSKNANIDTKFDPARKFLVNAYRFDWDGSSYGPVAQTFNIEMYEGDRDIETLTIYPMRFARDFHSMKAKFRSQGESFQRAVKQKHFYYNGWTLTHGYVPNANMRKNSEHIEGDVIIDFEEGFKADRSIQPPLFGFRDLERPNTGGWSEIEDNISIKHWENDTMAYPLEEIREVIQQNEMPGNYHQKLHANRNETVKAWQKYRHIAQIEGDDILLLPRRMVAYALRERKFVMADIQLLTTIPQSQDAFRDLKIDKDHKRLVKSLVKMHFQKRNFQRQRPDISSNQDLIRGKGSGLVILLHGVPGVGKTATAEAIAQAHKKPLFSITCGDLGITPKEVETSLRDIFRLAHLWDCILLLDEADIFLSRREVSDLTRNALVSGFRSRCQLSLYYKPLTKKQTLAIYDVNLQKLHEIEKDKEISSVVTPNAPVRPIIQIDDKSILDYAAWHFDNHKPYERWNGRQIRNSFQIAHSLAYFDMQNVSIERWNEEEVEAEDTPTPCFKLDYRQFERVALTIQMFDAYLYDAVSGSSIDNSRNQGLRADDHDSSEWLHNTNYHPTQQDTQQAVSHNSHEGFRLSRRTPLEYDPQMKGSQPQSACSSRKVYRPPQQTPSPQLKERQKSHEIHQRYNHTRPPLRVFPGGSTPRVKSNFQPSNDSGFSEWNRGINPREDYFSVEEGYIEGNNEISDRDEEEY